MKSNNKELDISPKTYSNKSPFKIAFLAILLWSTQALVMSKGTKWTDFSAILFPAFCSSSLFFFFFKTFYAKKNFKTNVIVPFYTNIGCIVFLSLIMLFSHFSFYLGLQMGPEVSTNLIYYLWPSILIVFSYSPSIIHFLKKILKLLKTDLSENYIEKVEHKRFKGIKIILGLTGVWMLLTHGHLNSLSFYNWKGPLLGFIAGVLWAVFSIYLKLMGKFSFIALFIGVTSIFSGILWGLRGYPNILPALHIAIILGLFPLGVAMFFWEKAMKSKRTQEIGMLAFLAPLLSTLWLYIFKIDYINRYSIIGGGLIVIANINLHDIVEKLNNYLEEMDKFKITQATKFKDIWARIAYNKNSTSGADFQTRLKIILSYLFFIFLLFLQKCRIPIFK